MRFILMYFIVILLFILPAGTVFADDVPVAILAFELNDLTLTPNIPEELERTASIKPLLNEALTKKDGYKIVEVNSAPQENADEGFGYLFDHHDVAAQLGRDAGAEWVIVGRVHKASFLFVYLMANVVNAETGQLAGELIVEVKGPQKKLTIKGVESLAEKIAETIQRKG